MAMNSFSAFRAYATSTHKTSLHHHFAPKNCTKSHTLPKVHPRNYTLQPPHSPSLAHETKRLQTDIISSKQILPIEKLSHHLATPPPADTALMTNSGSLCNGRAHDVEVQHASLSLKLSFSAPHSVRCAFLVLLNFLFVGFVAQKPKSALWWPCAYCIIQHNSQHNDTIRFAFDSGYAAVIAMQKICMLKSQSCSCTSSFTATQKPHLGTKRLPPRTMHCNHIPIDDQDTCDDGENHGKQRKVMEKRCS